MDLKKKTIEHRVKIVFPRNQEFQKILRIDLIVVYKKLLHQTRDNSKIAYLG